MSKIGHNYGSEYHLLRWMGRHRKTLDSAVLSKIGRVGDQIKWLDFGFNPKGKWPDAEIQGMDFLKEDEGLQENWGSFWPVGAGIHNWDAVGWVASGEIQTLLLVEAKAHVAELKTNCNAKDEGSIEKIKKAFEITKTALGVPNRFDWMTNYYQVTNRIAALYFLHQHKIPAHLLFIYFIGDLCDSGRNSPQSEREWQVVLTLKDEYIGLPKHHLLEDWIHELFLRIDYSRTLG